MTTPTVEATLLASLGLPASASSQDVEAAHEALVEYLEEAPSDLRGWARQQIGAIDEAFAILSDPTIDRSALAVPAAVAATATTRKPKVEPIEDDDDDDDDDLDDLDDEIDDEPKPRRTRHASRSRSRTASAHEPVAYPTGSDGRGLIKRVAIGALAVVGVVAIVIGGFNLNGGTRLPSINGSPAPEAAASPGVDPARVAVLMQKIQTDPKDVVSLQALADLYYQVSDFKTAGAFLEKILAVDPRNQTALLALGAAQFNEGDVVGAEKQWRAVLAIDPKNVEAHYDLGFMYLNQTPPDTANAKLEWSKVIELDPTSKLAKTVATHIASLDGSPAPSASGAPASGAPSSAIPAPSPSPVPSAK